MPKAVAYAPPPLLVKILHFHAFFWNKVKLTPLFSAKMWLTPPTLAHFRSATEKTQMARPITFCVTSKVCLRMLLFDYFHRAQMV